MKSEFGKCKWVGDSANSTRQFGEFAKDVGELESLPLTEKIHADGLREKNWSPFVHHFRGELLHTSTARSRTVALHRYRS